MNITLNKGTLVWTIGRGVSAMVTINKTDGWVYDEIVMDFKSAKDLDGSRIFRLEVGSGLTVNGNQLSISLTAEQTAILRAGTIWADVKLRNGNTVLPPIPFQLIVNQTVTKL